ncbi:MAG TPA: response regulator [Anaeromyxobacteraceae bacterium]|jgi:CheY-like chemotaxis protein|nr:response regulator [Anaeromyxobacteraceae bacterium]
METKKPKVLLVDDDEANLRGFRRAFQYDYEIGAVPSGQAALDLLADDPGWDLALVDYSMAGMNGLELLHRLQAQYPGIARFVLTAHADLPEVAAASSSGLAVAVLMKPWHRDDIAQAVKRALQLASMRRAVESMKSRLGGP